MTRYPPTRLTQAERDAKASTAQAGNRQRADGSWTYCSPEHDADWYFPVGTVVEVATLGIGTVVKRNQVTVNVQFATTLRLRVSVKALKRVAA